MSPRLRVGGRSDVGLQRQENQDSMYAGPWLAAVADGVGGAARGDIASRLAISALMPLDSATNGEPRAALRAALDEADAAIRDTVGRHGEFAGMSTTLTALLATPDELVLAHIGDSRAYRLRGGTLEQLTHDHSLVQSLIDEGQITEEEALTHPRRSWILRALDGRGQPDLDLTAVDTEPGDRFLVCSDGLSSYVAEPDIVAGLGLEDPQAAADRLVDLALRAGGVDNVTCVVADAATDDDDPQAALLGGAVSEPAPPELRGFAGAPDEHTATSHARPKTRSIGKRLAVVAGIVVVLIAAAVIATVVYINHQWYVAASAGKVAVFQGVQGKAVGIDLSHRHALTDIPVTALPQDDRERIGRGIQSDGGQSAATTIVANLRHDACALATASPTAKPSPSAAKRSHHKKRRTTPTPPPPSWCRASG